MHRYILSRGAMKSLRRIPKARIDQIFEVFEELVGMGNPAEHHNTKEMKGSWKGFYRVRIGSYRAIFEINPDPEAAAEKKLLLLSVEAIGTRGGIY